MSPLDDGTYSAVVVEAIADVERVDVVHLELAISAGSRKGDVIAMTSMGTTRRDIDLLGLPVTLTVRDGMPRVVFD
jgi:hypothetical protein